MLNLTAMRPAAPLAPAFGSLKPDHRRKLRPVDRIKPFVLGTDRHRAFQRSDDFAPIRQTRLVRDSRQRMALWTGLVPLFAVASVSGRPPGSYGAWFVKLVFQHLVVFSLLGGKSGRRWALFGRRLPKLAGRLLRESWGQEWTTSCWSSSRRARSQT